jgi:hypothetical protein
MGEIVEFIDTSDPIFWGCDNGDEGNREFNYGTIPHIDCEED